MRTGKVLALLLVALTGCDRTYLDVYTCQNPDEDHKDANGEPDPCHYNDPAASDAGLDDAGGTCAGQCAPHIPPGWSTPALVWVGAEAAAPPCSSVVGNPSEIYTGHADPEAPVLCGACKCDPPTGSCTLPATLTASSALCPGDGSSVVHSSFDPPASWGGTCTPANAIPAAKLCNGVPCVQSVTIAPLTIKQDDCLPIPPDNVQQPPTWKTFARACAFDSFSLTCNTTGVCTPRPLDTAFKVCTVQAGNPNKLKCPAGYPHRSVFYDDVFEAASCSPCTCQDPTGGTCTGSIGLFSDGACGAPLLGPTLSIDAKGPKCYDLPQGSALGSKSASEPIFTAGACVAKGGGLTNGVLPLGAEVICCLETP